MRTLRRRSLSVEPLEDRLVPTAIGSFGAPWPDADHLTMSFVPDGTPTLNGPSKLFQSLNMAGPTAAWQREILRAYQKWIDVSNIDLALIADGGQATGSPGAVQGDSRFGDLRISASPMPRTIHANAAPFHWTGTTLSGDVTYNANTHYEIGNNSQSAYDVFSVAIHEAGHTLGLDLSEVFESVMYKQYRDYTTLGVPDVTAIQELYGVRLPDSWDAAADNGSLANASVLNGSLNAAPILAVGDLTTSSDIDFYQFNVPALSLLSTVSVRLKASDMSLLTSKITVTNSFGTTVASAMTLDPLSNDLSVQFNAPLLGGTFRVQVERGNAAFAVGAYRLAIELVPLGGLTPLLNTILAPLDLHANDTLGSATVLPTQNPQGLHSRFDYYYTGTIEDATDKDIYRIQAPSNATENQPNLNVLVWARDANMLWPRIRVYDAASNPIAFQVLGNESGLMSVRVPKLTPGAIYYVRVDARVPGDGPGSIGQYALAADFNAVPDLPYESVADRHITPAATTTIAMQIDSTGFFQFALSARATGLGSGVVSLTVRNALGVCLFTLDATIGQPTLTTNRYLAAGNYTVELTNLGTGPVLAKLNRLKLTDAVGTYKPSVNGPLNETNEPALSPEYVYGGSSQTCSGNEYYF